MFLELLKGFICFGVVLLKLTTVVYAAPSASKQEALVPHIPRNADQVREGLPNDPSLVDKLPEVPSSAYPPIVFPMDEGEGSKMVKRGCCERTRHVLEAGYDDTRRRIGIDVGECRKISKHSNERHQLTPERKNQCSQCPETSECVASQLRVQRVYLVGEPKVFDIVQECECVQTPPSCERRSQTKVFFEDTPYETAVDVGVCSGPCSESDGTSTKIYNISLKMDVGKCVGTCTKDSSLQCILRSPSNPDECLMSLMKKTNCSPQSYTQHNFQTTGNRRQTVLTINECGC
ncbi:uncharacterized protein LOC117122840 [Anneissia japonica]|uniref:uncharacterized protein LOC117122840 n=1 Tax=Anneissia japonica TaxID=1529436 RepID=UPI0014254FCA|nr:uncharacterized protein LOC117122840 [Anneissia japonica]